MQDGMSGLRSVCTESDSTVVPYAPTNFLSPTDTDFALNHSLSSNHLDESALVQSSENNLGHANPQNGTFVKVSSFFLCL